MDYAVPETVATLTGFREMEETELQAMVAEYGLAMDLDDLRFCRDYFRTEDREPTMTELRVIDTYWSGPLPAHHVPDHIDRGDLQPHSSADL